MMKTRPSFGVPPSGGRSPMNSNFEFIGLLPPEGGTPNDFPSRDIWRFPGNDKCQISNDKWKILFSPDFARYWPLRNLIGFRPSLLYYYCPDQCADVLQPISRAILGQPVNDLHRRHRVVKVRGADLNCARPGDDEFERVFGRRDSADADQRDLDRARGLEDAAHGDRLDRRA